MLQIRKKTPRPVVYATGVSKVEWNSYIETSDQGGEIL